MIFEEQMKPWSKWNEEIEISEDFQHLNVKYDLSLGLNVEKRTITQASWPKPKLFA